MTAPKEATLTFFHINDVYNGEHFAPFKSIFDDYNKKNKDDDHNKAFITHGGDFVAPSLQSTFDHGKAMVDILNELNVLVACIGNHELDLGIEVLRRRINQMKFPLLKSNLKLSKNNTDKKLLSENDEIVKDVHYFQPFKNIDSSPFQDFKIAFIGLMVPAKHCYKCKIFKDQFDVKNPIEEGMKIIKQEFEKNDVNLIIPLTHLDWKDDIKLANKIEEKEYESKVPMILGGHDHEKGIKYSNKKTVTVFKTGKDLEYCGKVSFNITKDITTGFTFSITSPEIIKVSGDAKKLDEKFVKFIEDRYNIEQAYKHVYLCKLDDNVYTTASEEQSKDGRKNIANLLLKAFITEAQANFAFFPKDEFDSSQAAAEYVLEGYFTITDLLKVDMRKQDLEHAQVPGKVIKDLYQNNYDNWHLFCYPNEISKIEDNKLYKIVTTDYAIHKHPDLKNYAKDNDTFKAHEVGNTHSQVVQHYVRDIILKALSECKDINVADDDFTLDKEGFRSLIQSQFEGKKLEDIMIDLFFDLIDHDKNKSLDHDEIQNLIDHHSDFGATEIKDTLLQREQNSS